MKEFATKQLWVCNIKNSAPNCHLLIWQTLPAVTTKEPKTHLLTRCMHLGLLRISNNGFGGRSKTGEHKEKSLRQKRWKKKKKSMHMCNDGIQYFPLRPVWNFKLWFWWRDNNRRTPRKILKTEKRIHQYYDGIK